MQALILFFAELCALRRAPQDLPASPFLFQLTLAADLLAGLLAGVVAGLPLMLALAQGGTEIVLMLALLYAGLWAYGRRSRFLQTAIAFLGSGALIALVAVVPLGLNPAGAEVSDLAALGVLLLLVVVAWGLLVAGHILRHAFDVSLGQGVAIAVAFEFFSVALIGGLFSGL